MSTETDSGPDVQDVAVTTRRYREAVEARDAEGVVATLSEDAVLRSPISSLARFEGRAAIGDVLRVVFEQISEPTGVTEMGDGDEERAVIIRSRVRGEDLEEAVWLRFDERGLIRELTMFIRPVPALTALMAAIGPPLAARHSRTRGAIAAAMTRPLAALTRHGDPIALRLAGVDRRE